MTNLSPTGCRPFWSAAKFVSRGEGRDRDVHNKGSGPQQPFETLFSPSEFLLFKIVSHCYHQFVHCIEKRAEAITFYHLLTLSQIVLWCSTMYPVNVVRNWMITEHCHEMKRIIFGLFVVKLRWKKLSETWSLFS